jgi:hypothetical protein
VRFSGTRGGPLCITTRQQTVLPSCSGVTPWGGSKAGFSNLSANVTLIAIPDKAKVGGATPCPQA